jgi:sulfhydrogenase subunit beta (sulfur reductase)
MKPAGSIDPSPTIINQGGLQALIDALLGGGFTIIAPRLTDDVIVLDEITAVDQLPAGAADEQEAARYRVTSNGGARLFDSTTTPQGWKRYLYPAEERLWQAKREGAGFTIVDETMPVPRYAFLGVRACDLKAIGVLDTVFNHSRSAEPRYVARRDQSFIIGVNCTRAGGTCFCTSMSAGPAVGSGADLVLTEFGDDAAPDMLIEARTAKGAAMLPRLGGRAAETDEVEAADAAVARAATMISRHMEPDAADVLKRNLEHREWEKVAQRCLSCANCTLVCPTCFCGSVEDTTDLTGTTAERWRKWDSCFTSDFSYIHGGSIRRSGASRYRQWITHKLSHWWQQFGSSGCVGCGRCITWCPVGIDITEQVRRIKESEGGLH